MKKSQNATFEPGKVLDHKWIIIELIGKGAMGEVYRAHQTNLKRDVAIKIISDDVMGEIDDDPDEMDVAFGRFHREVQTMAQVRHPNILTIFDYGEIEEITGSETSRIAYIVMEYIPGDSLRFTLSEDGLDDIPDVYGKWIRDYFMPIMDGVEILHNHKIVHRDLKPENVFMDGVIPKIADSGLARSVHMKAVTTSIEMLGSNVAFHSFIRLSTNEVIFGELQSRNPGDRKATFPCLSKRYETGIPYTEYVSATLPSTSSNTVEE